jgi:hypothetical protein
MTSPILRRDPRPTLGRDPRQSGRSGHDLPAAFPCDRFYPLDIRRVESAPA